MLNPSAWAMVTMASTSAARLDGILQLDVGLVLLKEGFGLRFGHMAGSTALLIHGNDREPCLTKLSSQCIRLHSSSCLASGF